MINSIQEYIKEKEELQDLLLDFIDGEDDEIFDKLQKYLQCHKIAHNYSEFKLFLRLLVILSNHHNRSHFFFSKIEKILQLIKDNMKKTFTESDLFDICYTNKRILLYLIQSKVIEVNNIISNFNKTNDILFKSYFYPELKDSFTKEVQEKINEQISNLDQDILDHFNEFRLTGENHSYLCSLIRQDSVKEFIIYVNKNSLSLNEFLIEPSLFESNSILNDNQKVTLIEYAAFYGSIEIFQYLLLQDVDLPSSLWEYAIHSRNAELIQKLVDYHVDGQDYIECLEESIKCHHNEITDYIINNLISLDENKKTEIFSFAFKYQNYNIINRSDINDINHIEEEIFYNSCKYDYESIILIRIKNQKKLNIDINKAFDFCCENETMNITQIFLDNKLIKIDKFSRCEKLKKIIIPTFIDVIKESSFLSCLALEEVTIPSSVLFIERSAFEYCESLKHVTIPSSVTRIGRDSFRGCKNLTTITLPSTILLIDQTSFEKCISLEKILISDKSNNHNLIIGDGAFEDCESLKQIPILSFCQRVDSSAFSGCEQLEQIIIPPSLTKLQNFVFSECKSLIQVTIPSTIKSIENHAFCSCSSLKKVSIETVFLQKINLGTFSGCSSLIEINIPSTVEEICKSAFFECESIKQIVIPSSVKIIGESTFKKCRSLTQITLPSKLEKIESAAFKKCESIKQIKIPSSCKLIGQKFFSGCTNLEEIELPSLINEIPSSMFKNCSSIKQFIIPSNVQIINSESFKGCSSLKELKIPSSVKSIKEFAFALCSSIEQLEIPSSVESIDSGAFLECFSLKQIIISSSLTEIPERCFEGCSSLVNIKLPDSIKSIKSRSFSRCRSLKQINIPSSVKSIKYFAFFGCLSLEDVNITSSAIKLKDGSFRGCPLLDSSKIKSKVKKFNMLAFDNCDKLMRLKQQKELLFQFDENAIDLNDYEFVEIISKNDKASIVKAREIKTRKDLVFKFYNFNLPVYINIYFAYILTNLNIPGIVKIQRYRHPLFKNENNYLDFAKHIIETSGLIVVKNYYKNGNLIELTEEYLNSNGSNDSILNPTIRSKIIFGVAAIMKKIHKLKIIHSNLTIGNVLLDDNCEPLINCFGYSNFDKCSISNDAQIGGVDYNIPIEFALSLAPERIDGDCPIFESDVFSYGIFVYLMFLPMKKMLVKNIFKIIHQIISEKRYARPNNIPDEYWELIQYCWRQSPNDRPSFEEITQLLRDDMFALEEFGVETDLDQLHEYQNRIDED